MGIQAFFGNTIIETSSDSLILSLTPMSDLDSVKQKEKIDLICARNRILAALNEASLKLSDISQRQFLQDKINIIEKFYDEIGGEVERTKAKLSFLSPTKLIEGSIPSTIIASLKPDSKCTKKELSEKEKQKNLRRQIIEASFEKAASEQVKSSLIRLLNELDCQHLAIEHMRFAGA